MSRVSWFLLFFAASSVFAQNGNVVDGLLNGNQVSGQVPAAAINPGGCAAGYFPDGTYTNGVANCSQIQATQVHGLAASATTDTTNAANIGSGTLSYLRLPIGTSSTTVAAGNDSRFLNATSINGTVITALSGVIKFTNGTPSAAAYGDIVGLFGSGTCSGYLKSDGTCSTPAVTYSIRTVTAAADTATTSDYTVLDNAASGAITETLPASPPTGFPMHIKKADTTTNTVTVSGNGHSIDGAATQILTQPYESIELQFDGSVWWIL